MPRTPPEADFDPLVAADVAVLYAQISTSLFSIINSGITNHDLSADFSAADTGSAYFRTNAISLLILWFFYINGWSHLLNERKVKNFSLAWNFFVGNINC